MPVEFRTPNIRISNVEPDLPDLEIHHSLFIIRDSFFTKQNGHLVAAMPVEFCPPRRAGILKSEIY
jgi:hypothetical protein